MAVNKLSFDLNTKSKYFASGCVLLKMFKLLGTVNNE